ELRQPIPSLAESGADAVEVGEVEEHGARVMGERLVEAEEAGRVPEVARAEDLELLRVRPKVIGAARDPVDGVHDDVGRGGSPPAGRGRGAPARRTARQP